MAKNSKEIFLQYLYLIFIITKLPVNFIALNFYSFVHPINYPLFSITPYQIQNLDAMYLYTPILYRSNYVSSNLIASSIYAINSPLPQISYYLDYQIALFLIKKFNSIHAAILHIPNEHIQLMVIPTFLFTISQGFRKRLLVQINSVLSR